MTDRNAIDKTLATFRDRLQEKYTIERAQRRISLEGWHRRKKVEARYHEKLLRKILVASEIDLEEIKHRHQRDRESWMRYRDEQMRLVLDSASVRADRQRVKNDQHIYQAEQFDEVAISVTRFYKAHSIVAEKSVDKEGDPEVILTEPMTRKGEHACENWVKFRCHAFGKGDSYDINYDFHYHFVWDSPLASGLATVTSWVQPNGGYLVWAEDKYYNDAHVGIRAEFHTLQVTGYGPDEHSAEGVTLVNAYYDSAGPITGVVVGNSGGMIGGVYPVDDEVKLTIDLVPYQAGYPLLCTMTIRTNVWVTGDGEALLDFFKHPYWLNVPGVVIKHEDY